MSTAAVAFCLLLLACGLALLVAAAFNFGSAPPAIRAVEATGVVFLGADAYIIWRDERQR